MAGIEVRMGANVQSAVKGIQDVSLKLKDQQAILKNLQLEYAKLDTAAARSSAGKLIAQDIKIAKEEIARLSVAATSGFGAVGGGATKALSAVRGLAHILPGLGVAGIFNVLFEQLSQISFAADGAANHFNDLSKSIEGAKGEFVKASVNVEQLKSQVELARLGFISKDQVVKFYNETIGKTTGLVNSLKGAEEGLARNAAAYIQVTLFKAVATTAYGKAAEETFKQMLRMRQIEQTEKLGGIFELFGPLAKEKSKTTSESLIKDFLDIAKGAEFAAGIISKLFGFNFFGDNKPIPPPKLDPVKKEIREALGSIQIPLPTFLDPPRDARTRLQRQLSELTTELTLKIPLDVDSTPGKSFQNLQKRVSGQIGVIRDQLLADIKSINDAIKGIAVDSLANVGEAIGTALGGGDLKNVFSNFANIIGSGLQAIGKQLIAIGVAALLAKEALKTLFANPAVSIAAGIALIAAGAALKSALSGGIEARARGGPVSGGGAYLVGEKGPEIFVPGESGQIIPNNKLSPVSGGASTNINLGGYIEIDGRKLKLILARQGAYDSRNV